MSFVDPDRHRSLFPVCPRIVRNGRQFGRAFAVGKGFALEDYHAAEQLRAMFRTQIRFLRQDQVTNIHISVIDRFETVNDRAAHQRHLASVSLDFLMRVDPVDRHRQIQFHDIAGLPCLFQVEVTVFLWCGADCLFIYLQSDCSDLRIGKAV